MANVRLLVAETLALLLVGCPLAMTDDYVIQAADDRGAAAVADAGSIPMDAGSTPMDAGSTPMDAGSIIPDVRVCVPTTCLLFGAECGPAPDGCGAMLDCGMCKGDKLCGSKSPNRCDKQEPG